MGPCNFWDEYRLEWMTYRQVTYAFGNGLWKTSALCPNSQRMLSIHETVYVLKGLKTFDSDFLGEIILQQDCDNFNYNICVFNYVYLINLFITRYR